MQIRIDVGGMTYLPCCECGWRGLPALDRAEAWTQAVHHERRAHPGSDDATRGRAQQRRRDALRN